jgi:hypothetical protein
MTEFWHPTGQKEQVYAAVGVTCALDRGCPVRACQGFAPGNGSAFSAAVIRSVTSS